MLRLTGYLVILIYSLSEIKLKLIRSIFSNRHKHSRIVAGILLFVLIVVLGNIPPQLVQAANLTTLSDNMSRIKASTLSDHTIDFVTPTGVIALNQTITLNFNSFTTVTAVTASDVSLGVSSSSACSGFSARTVNASPGLDIWGVGVSSTTVTFTAPSSGTIGTSGILAGKCVEIRIGANRTGGGGTTRITSPGTGLQTISIAGTFGDTGTIGVAIIANDQVALTATVNPTLTFTLSQTSLGFGALTTANGRWATNGGGANVATAGLRLATSTNGVGGYTIYVLGDTLKDGTKTITALGSSTASSPNNTQFGMNVATFSTGTGVITLQPPYSTASQYGWTATGTTQTSVVTNTGPDSGSQFDISYLANISGITPAGNYTATHTWTATGNF